MYTAEDPFIDTAQRAGEVTAVPLVGGFGPVEIDGVSNFRNRVLEPGLRVVHVEVGVGSRVGRGEVLAFYVSEPSMDDRRGCLTWVFDRARRPLAMILLIVAAAIAAGLWADVLGRGDERSDALVPTERGTDDVTGTAPVDGVTEVEPLVVAGDRSCVTETFTATVEDDRVRATPEGSGEIRVQLVSALQDVPLEDPPDFALLGLPQLLGDLELDDRPIGSGAYQLLVETDDRFPDGTWPVSLVATVGGDECSIALLFDTYVVDSPSGDPFGDLPGVRCSTPTHHALLNGTFFVMRAEEVWSRALPIEPDRTETLVVLRGDRDFVDNAQAFHRGDQIFIQASAGVALPPGEHAVTVTVVLPDGECSYDITMTVEA